MTALVTVSLAALLAFPAVSCAKDQPAAAGRAARARTASDATKQRAQDRQPAGPAQPGQQTPRRLESINWNPVKNELTWVVSKGDLSGGNYKPLSSDNYLINMADATMTYNGETRRFSKQEAENVEVLMDLLSKYAVDSTVWWDQGQGEPLDGSSPAPGATPAPTKKQKKANVLRVNQQRERKFQQLMARLDRLQEAVFPAAARP